MTLHEVARLIIDLDNEKIQVYFYHQMRRKLRNWAKSILSGESRRANISADRQSLIQVVNLYIGLFEAVYKSQDVTTDDYYHYLRLISMSNDLSKTGKKYYQPMEIREHFETKINNES